MDTPAVELLNVSRRFGTVPALADVSLSIQKGEFFSLLGPSGCGKTTLLRLIAGLDLPDQGTLRIGGADATSVPAHRRPVNTVFQSYALFPHLSVQENVAFGLRMKKVAREEIAQRVTKIMDLVQISSLSQRKPSQLSGGQKQRVALARAIVNEPEVLLLDEPLGALDLKLRRELQVELHALQRRLGITFIFVTHDQEEALAMSDRIAVMNGGRIEQLGAASDIYDFPRTRFVAQFLGACNLIDGTIANRIGNKVTVKTPWADLQAELPMNGREVPVGSACTLAIRPEKVQLADSFASPGSNLITAAVIERVYSGAETEYHLEASSLVLRAKSLNANGSKHTYALNQRVAVYLPPSGLILLND